VELSCQHRVHWPLAKYTDIIGTVGYAGAKANIEGDRVSDDGYSLGVGVRSRLADRFELGASVGYADFSELGSTTSYGLGAQLYFTDDVALSVSGAYRDHVTTYAIGLRGMWGRRPWQKD